MKSSFGMLSNQGYGMYLRKESRLEADGSVCLSIKATTTLSYISRRAMRDEHCSPLSSVGACMYVATYPRPLLRDRKYAILPRLRWPGGPGQEERENFTPFVRVSQSGAEPFVVLKSFGLRTWNSLRNI